MDLNDKDAIGHFREAIGNASDAARLARFQPWMILGVRDQLVNAHEALRGMGLLRSDERWVAVSNLIRGFSDLLSGLQQPRLGDPRWTEIAERLGRVRDLAERMFTQSDAQAKVEPIIEYRGLQRPK